MPFLSGSGNFRFIEYPFDQAAYASYAACRFYFNTSGNVSYSAYRYIDEDQKESTEDIFNTLFTKLDGGNLFLALKNYFLLVYHYYAAADSTPEATSKSVGIKKTKDSDVTWLMYNKSTTFRIYLIPFVIKKGEILVLSAVAKSSSYSMNIYLYNVH